MNMKRFLSGWYTWVIVLIIFFCAGLKDEDLRFKRISDAINRFTMMYPQMKVYLHTDKKDYRGGEVMWIKAYLVNGMDHLPDTLVTNLYVELISPTQTRVEIKRFQMFDGFGTGDFQLNDTLPEGLYQIRAYTAWMQNFDAAYYFKMNFQVINPYYRKIISPKQARINEKELDDRDKMTGDIDLQFMPEGGDLVNGIESVVAFKAINKLGKGSEISGTVYDQKGNRVTDFKTFRKGIGTFVLKPEKDVKYFALVKTGNKEMKVALPPALEKGFVMHAENRLGSIGLHIVSNNQTTNDPVANEVIIAAQMGGKIYYGNIARLENGKVNIEIPKNIFPPGILQITVFSGRSLPVAERLVFIGAGNYMNISMGVSDSLSDDGKKIAVEIRATDFQHRPLKANLSLSVTRDRPDQPESNHENILSSLLLSSDLKGYIEDPLDYFTALTPENITALDNLMMTQGWRRFDWNRILAGKYPEILYHEEKGITVSGKLTRDFFGIPLKDCPVRLSIMDKYNDVFTQQSAKNGTFSFNNLVYYDTVNVRIEAWRQSGRKNLVIILPDEKQNPVTNQQGDYTLTTLSERDNRAYRMTTNQESKEAYDRQKKLLEEDRKNGPITLYSEPDNVLYAKDFHTATGNVLDVIKGRIPGVQVTGNSVLIRGINTFYGSTQPLYLVDGVPVNDVSAVTSIPIEDIERVEVLKGPSTSVYGARGANGVIAVFTKHGQYLIRGRIDFSMLGYSTPRKFYQPKYTPEQEPPIAYTVIWKPMIVTNDEGKARVEFDKPLIQGEYRFDIEGISYAGDVGYAWEVLSNQ